MPAENVIKWLQSEYQPSKDYIAEHIGWLDGILTHPENPGLFQDENLSVIQRDLANRWPHENRLELLNDLADKYGEEAVFAVIDKIIDANCRRDWELVGKERGNSFANFLKILWEPVRDSGFEFTYETEGKQTKFCVTKCACMTWPEKSALKNGYIISSV